MILYTAGLNHFILNQAMDNTGKISVSHLSEGIYQIIRLVQGGRVQTGKVMIE